MLQMIKRRQLTCAIHFYLVLAKVKERWQNDQETKIYH
jgi:hypothetical protein